MPSKNLAVALREVLSRQLLLERSTTKRKASQEPFGRWILLHPPKWLRLAYGSFPTRKKKQKKLEKSTQWSGETTKQEGQRKGATEQLGEHEFNGKPSRFPKS